MNLRQERMADEIRDYLAGLFQGGRLNDPRLSAVTISAVKLTADLQLASVYFRLYPGANQHDAQKGLQAAAGVLRGVLAKNLKVRRVPVLRFFYDESIEYGSRVEQLISQIHQDVPTDLH